MQLYYNSLAYGGDGNHDFGDANNFWEDSGWTVPAAALPTSTDDVELDDFVAAITYGAGLAGLAGTLTDTSGTGANYLGAGAITVTTSATGVQVNGGVMIISPSSGALACIGCIFTTDPQFAAVYHGTVSTSSSCEFNSSMGGSDAIPVIDDGSAVWGGGIAISFASFSAPIISTTSSITFSCPIICPAIDAPNAFFESTITQNGAGVQLVVGNMNGAVTWNGVTSLSGSPSINCVASESWSGSTITYTLTGSGGTVSLVPAGGGSQILSG